jgi:23S rRNA (pseudouridine1915-N3)-methyltransferase
MKITIITVGKKHDLLLASAINDYTERAGRHNKIIWEYISPSGKPEAEARVEESAQIIQKCSNSAMVWLLDERGEQLSSPALSKKLETLKTHAVKSLTIIIGGAYGVDDTLRERADFIWSLSKLVLPHQLARLVLSEQLYRAGEIARGSGYHHA